MEQELKRMVEQEWQEDQSQSVGLGLSEEGHSHGSACGERFL